MHICRCTTSNCSGRNVDARTWKRHQQADQQRSLSQAIAETADALHAQDDDISSYIASLALADERVAPSELDPLLHSAYRTAPQVHSRLPLFSRAIDTCFTLEIEVKLLEKDAASHLDALPMPSSRTDLFPLEKVYESLRRLRNRHTLLPVVVKASQVKKALGTRIFSLEKKVNEARSLWCLQASRFKETSPELPTIFSYDTGLFLKHCGRSITDSFQHITTATI